MLERNRHRGNAVILAEREGQAGRIYRRLGFESVGVVEALEGPWPQPSSLENGHS